MQLQNQTFTVGGISLPKQFLLDLTGLGLPANPVQSRTPTPVSNTAGTWEVVHYARNPYTSYCGALLKTTLEGKPAYVIWHYGTTDIHDVPHGLTITLGSLPQQLRDAMNFTRHCKEYVAEHSPDAPIIQAGHSLGGALAILANKEKDPCITMDAPGTRHFLKKLKRDPKHCPEYTLEILSPDENVVNTQGQPVGMVLIPEKPKPDAPHSETPKRHTLVSFIRTTTKSHRLGHIHTALKESDSLTLLPPDEVKRSATFLHAFAAFRRNLPAHQEPDKEDISRIPRHERRMLRQVDNILQTSLAGSVEKCAKRCARVAFKTVSSVSGVAVKKENRTLEFLSPEEPEQKPKKWTARLTKSATAELAP